MRIGKNPAKGAAKLTGFGAHRVIVPVYVPHFDGYFADAREIVACCLESLFSTTRGLANITVIANGSAPEMVQQLEQWFSQGWFDQLVVNATNRGKVDAIVGAARGCFEPLVTFCDADVLFRHGWTDAVDDVFRAFPEAGAVSPITYPPTVWTHSTATLLGAWAGRELRPEKVVSDEALDVLCESLGQADYVPPELRQAQLTVCRSAVTATVGIAHAVATWRREAIDVLPASPSLTTVGGGSEKLWMDEPIDRAGLWRLSTPTPWAQHMGNVMQPWMRTELESTRQRTPSRSSARAPLSQPRPSWVRVIPLPLRQFLVRQLRRRFEGRATGPVSTAPAASRS